MAGWREQKRTALADIHETFEIPAVYITHAAGTPVRVTVRLHKAQVASQNQAEDFRNGPTLLDLTNRIVFQLAQGVKPLGKAYVIFGNSEAYRTSTSRPEREGYVAAEVSEVSQADLDALLAGLDTTGTVWEGIIT
ncbi:MULTISPECIES: hypothetical protein [unclassified Mesorhizobium]|uniref:hypothetical protein n=1 Tax=unclassified Mesorhizobium TaxID=325217 RepID=UPI001093906D|nr:MULTISPECIES: hypothetical protein [unclassified Mesorhizobium]TGT90925.1 hypothetical protein EN804_06205 [Mesorhizobium sp. M8A.F.Ca.ET.161.01.1.1]TGV43795.1 hypothetical protein EN785_07340 [Mesorhizobium sp. M8A.F.Ca.ET.142.01.1.1]